MSDIVLPVQKSGMEPPARPIMPAGTENAPAGNVEGKAADVKAAESFAKPQENTPAQKTRTNLPLKEMTDVRLKYKVDSETKELTVMVIDKSSHKVIRTIPPEELKNFQEGDLFELSS